MKDLQLNFGIERCPQQIAGNARANSVHAAANGIICTALGAQSVPIVIKSIRSLRWERIPKAEFVILIDGLDLVKRMDYGHRLAAWVQCGCIELSVGRISVIS